MSDCKLLEKEINELNNAKTYVEFYSKLTFSGFFGAIDNLSNGFFVSYVKALTSDDDSSNNDSDDLLLAFAGVIFGAPMLLAIGLIGIVCGALDCLSVIGLTVATMAISILSGLILEPLAKLYDMTANSNDASIEKTYVPVPKRLYHFFTADKKLDDVENMNIVTNNTMNSQLS